MWRMEMKLFAIIFRICHNLINILEDCNKPKLLIPSKFTSFEPDRGVRIIQHFLQMHDIETSLHNELSPKSIQFLTFNISSNITNNWTLSIHKIH